MTTIAIPRAIPPHRSSSPTPPLTPLSSLESIIAKPIPIPNKHIPHCPTGPAPAARKPDTPPASPPSKHADVPSNSLLFPPDAYRRLTSRPNPIYSIDAAGIAAALEYASQHPLPEPADVFPYLHGLHQNNHVQQAFFIARRRSLRKTPKCVRGITVVKASGDLSRSKLKGAIAPEEFMQTRHPEFRDIDPKDGFSVRNFQIQAGKSAMLSDIIVYGDDEVQLCRLAKNIAAAQQSWLVQHVRDAQQIARYNTFVCSSTFNEFEISHPELVAIDSEGRLTGHVMDFSHQERHEMCTMTAASEISANVWLGPTPDPSIVSSLVDEEDPFDIYIECSDMSQMNPKALERIARGAEDGSPQSHPAYLEFPSSGSVLAPAYPTYSHPECDGIVDTCKWIHALANAEVLPSSPPATPRPDGNTPMPDSGSHKPRKILIHCTDGYTESTLLAISYQIYATGQPVHAAWLELHTKHKRNFFAYPSDVALLAALAPRLLACSPALAHTRRSSLADNALLTQGEPRWVQTMDGSLPSRITPYMYLGNLNHANNPDMLRGMGINQILSVGETFNWDAEEQARWGQENIMLVQQVQDNGVDPLTCEFDRCLDFIGIPSCPSTQQAFQQRH